jgi:hypothetical protein
MFIMSQVLIYTTAPVALDIADAQTAQLLGTYVNGNGPRTYRCVTITEEQAKPQRSRYGAAQYNTHTETEWQELQI